MVLRPALNYYSDALVISVGQKYRLCVGVAYVKMINSVYFLFDSCKLVFFDYVVFVFIYADTAEYACLHSAVHNLSVNIKRRSLLLCENALCSEIRYIVSCFFVYLLRVLVCLRQIYLSSADMKKAVWISLCHLGSFFSVHYVVWK